MGKNDYKLGKKSQKIHSCDMKNFLGQENECQAFC